MLGEGSVLHWWEFFWFPLSFAVLGGLLFGHRARFFFLFDSFFSLICI
jgi:hypothetical protein